MFTLHQKFEKLYSIEWYFPDDKVEEMEDRLMVTFTKENDYFLLQEVLYAYIDIVSGLEDLDFICEKIKKRMKIKILNI